MKLPLPGAGPWKQTTFLYDRDGRLITALHADVDRTPVPLAQMPLHLRQAVIAAEDEGFYHHHGVSPMAILRALWANVTHHRIEQGGSTITQQYVRSESFRAVGRERTLWRKIEEAVLAVKLENNATKDQILENYLNSAYFGHGAYGVQAAAKTYFSRPARKLSVLQSATLAGAIAAPAAFDPIDDPKGAMRRRNYVLSRMVVLGYLSPEEGIELVRQPVRTDPAQPKTFDRSPAPYYVAWAKKWLQDRYGKEGTFAGGLRVRLGLDMDMQRAAQAAIDANLPYPEDPDVALVAMDPRNGEIRAMVSLTRGKNYRHAQCNLATASGAGGNCGTGRQTGSAFKMFTVATAVHQGISLRSRFNGPGEIEIKDPECNTSPTEPWSPSNYSDSGAGTLDLLGATAHSVNTIFAQLVVKVGPENVARMAHQMGIRSRLKPVCSITLGTQAVSPMDMVTGFSTLASRGVRHWPTPVETVRSSSGDLLDRTRRDGKRVLTQHEALQVVYALKGVVTGGTGVAANLPNVDEWGKTGTTDGHTDAYFCGGTSVLVACVWIGFHEAEIPMTNVHGISPTGGSFPAAIWADFMAVALRGLNPAIYPTPELTGRIVRGQVALVSPSPSPSPDKPGKGPKPKPKPSPSITISPSP